MSRQITGAATVAGVVGSPVTHSLSPILHNAWLDAAGINGAYVPFAPTRAEFGRLVAGLRGGVVRGLNVTLPFKEEALDLATQPSERARLAGAANLLLFRPDGEVEADNTDGLGLLHAFARQAPDFLARNAVVTILGAGGAARGATAAFLLEDAREIRIVNRTHDKATAIAELDGRIRAFGWDALDAALGGADALINATSLGLEGGPTLDVDLGPLPTTAAVMDMVYRPLETPLLAAARLRGHPVVDGLEMLIGQAIPSYRAFYGAEPPQIDVRALAIQALGL